MRTTVYAVAYKEPRCDSEHVDSLWFDEDEATAAATELNDNQPTWNFFANCPIDRRRYYVTAMEVLS